VCDGERKDGDSWWLRGALVPAHRVGSCRVIGPRAAGLALVIAVEFGLITSMAVFKPVFGTYRLDQVLTDRVALTLSAWSVTSGRPSPR
jgi:hypothetical protein